jgi:hypothetical protein
MTLSVAFCMILKEYVLTVDILLDVANVILCKEFNICMKFLK